MSRSIPPMRSICRSQLAALDRATQLIMRRRTPPGDVGVGGERDHGSAPLYRAIRFADPDPVLHYADGQRTCPVAPSSIWARRHCQSATMCTRRSNADTLSSPLATIRSRSPRSSWAQKDPQVVHVGYQPATVEQVYFPQPEAHRQPGPLCALRGPARRLGYPRASTASPSRGVAAPDRGPRARENRFPPTPQRLVHDVRAVMPPKSGSSARQRPVLNLVRARLPTPGRRHAPARRCAGHYGGWTALGDHGLTASTPSRRMIAVCGDGGFMMNSPGNSDGGSAQAQPCCAGASRTTLTA